jgi:hypothetical protein
MVMTVKSWGLRWNGYVARIEGHEIHATFNAESLVEIFTQITDM